MLTKTFPASLDHLREMLDFVHHFALKQGFDATMASKIMLAAEEAIVNVIRHGYPSSKQEKVEITCEESYMKPGLKLLIKDYGIPFDPVKQLEKNPKKTELSQVNTESNMGGYGIFIYVGLMDRVEYFRTEDGNLLLLTKYL